MREGEDNHQGNINMHPIIEGLKAALVIWFGASGWPFGWGQDNSSTSCLEVEPLTTNNLALKHLPPLGGAAAMVFSASAPQPLCLKYLLQSRGLCSLAMFTDSVLWLLTSFFLLWHCEICSLPQGVVSAGSEAPVWSCRLLQLFITSFIISDVLYKAPVPVS